MKIDFGKGIVKTNLLFIFFWPLKKDKKNNCY